MSVKPSHFSRLNRYWLAASLFIGCSVSGVGTIVYFAWAAQPLAAIAIAEIVGQVDSQILVEGQPAKPGTALRTGQQVLTPDAVRVALKQADQVVARLGEQSAAILERDCLQLGEGQLVISGLSGCVGAAIVTPRDAIVVLERLGTLAEVKVLAGEVNLAIPSNPALEAITLKANQKVILNLTGDTIGPVRLMLPSEIKQIATGELFQGFQLAIVNQNFLVGLLPSPPPSPSPSPTPAVSPTPTPTPSPPVSHPPAATAPPVIVPPTPQALNYSSLAKSTEELVPEQKSYRSSPPVNSYSRSPRRRRYEERAASSYSAPAADSYTPRRRWTRSSADSYSRRRTPSYAPPSYIAPAHPTPADSAPAHPVPSQESPALPEAPVMELPTPIEAPPSVAEPPPAPLMQ